MLIVFQSSLSSMKNCNILEKTVKYITYKIPNTQKCVFSCYNCKENSSMPTGLRANHRHMNINSLELTSKGFFCFLQKSENQGDRHGHLISNFRQ